MNDIMDTDGLHLNMENYKFIDVDSGSKLVTFGGGITYNEL